jgi:hypothetical protein
VVRLVQHKVPESTPVSDISEKELWVNKYNWKENILYIVASKRAKQYDTQKGVCISVGPFARCYLTY